jgi:hypothetical protein
VLHEIVSAYIDCMPSVPKACSVYFTAQLRQLLANLHNITQINENLIPIPITYTAELKLLPDVIMQLHDKS